MVLKRLQSTDSRGTVALANGLVGDMISSAELGGGGVISLLQYVGPFAVTYSGWIVESVFGLASGLLLYYYSWRKFCVVVVLLLLETCREVVGDWSVPPPPLNNSVAGIIQYRRRKQRGIEVEEAILAELRKNYRFRLSSPVPRFVCGPSPETAIILLTLGLHFSVFHAVITGATSSFQKIYNFNDIQTALMYLPVGCGGICSAFTTGRIVDWHYRRHAKRSGITVVKGVRHDITNFNIERVKLEIALPMYYIALAMVVIYGWLMGRKVNIAAPIILLFVSGWALIATSQVLNALMVDLWPGNSTLRRICFGASWVLARRRRLGP